MPKLYLNKNSVIDQVFNEDIEEEIEKATKFKKLTKNIEWRNSFAEKNLK